MEKVIGANQEVNAPKISHNFLDDEGAVLAKLKQAFRSTQNTFKKLPQNLKKSYLTKFSTN